MHKQLGQAMTEYVILAGMVSIVMFLGLMGQPSMFGSDIQNEGGVNHLNASHGRSAVKSTPCDLNVDLSDGAANLAAKRQSCLRKSIYAL